MQSAWLLGLAALKALARLAKLGRGRRSLGRRSHSLAEELLLGFDRAFLGLALEDGLVDVAETPLGALVVRLVAGQVDGRALERLEDGRFRVPRVPPVKGASRRDGVSLFLRELHLGELGGEHLGRGETLDDGIAERLNVLVHRHDGQVLDAGGFDLRELGRIHDGSGSVNFGGSRVRLRIHGIFLVILRLCRFVKETTR